MKKLYLLLFLMLTIGFAHGQITCPSNQSAATDVDECSASNVSLPLPGNLPNGFADTITYTLSGATTQSSSSFTPLYTSMTDSFFVGVTTVTYTIDTLANSGSVTCVFTVTVSDEQAPDVSLIAGQPYTVQVDGTGNVDLAVALADTFNLVLNDNCDVTPLDVTFDIQNFDCDDIGTTHTVEVTVLDSGDVASAGNLPNESVATIYVTIADTVSPVALCYAQDTVYIDELGATTLIVADIDSASMDNCEIDTMWLSNYGFTCADTGSYNDTLTVTDIYGNSSTCVTTVTVLDTIAPKIFCLDDTVYLDRGGDAEVLLANILDSIWENSCEAVLTNIDTVMSDTFFHCATGNYDTVITVTIYDHAMLSGTCTSTITVMDTVSPEAFCIAKDTVYLDDDGIAFATWMNVLDSAWDNCSLVDTSLMEAGNDTVWFSCDQVNLDSTVLVIVEDHVGLTGTCESTITVLDTTSPEIFCLNDTIYLDRDGFAEVMMPELVDSTWENSCLVNQDTMLSDTFFYCMGGDYDTTITVTLIDYAGNDGTCTSTITVLDTVSPEIWCVERDTIYLDYDGTDTMDTYLYITGVLVDSTWENCTIDTLVLGAEGSESTGGDTITADCRDVGTHGPIPVSVIDASGNWGTCWTSITIMDTIKPDELCQDVNIYLDSMGNTAVSANMVDGGSWDACGIDTLLISLDSTVFTDSIWFDCEDVGDIDVLLKVVDNHGNESTCTSTVTVWDEIYPMIDCVYDTTVYLDQDGLAVMEDFGLLVESVWDNCDYTLKYTGTAYDCTQVDNTIMTYVTVTDDSGNSSTCDVSVTVKDQYDPVIVCDELSVDLWENGEYVLDDTEKEELVKDVWDNCTDLDYDDIAVDLFSFECVNVETDSAKVKYTVSDEHGNTTVKYCYVEVNDVTDPVAMCIDTVQLILDENGRAILYQSDVNDGDDHESTPEWARFYNDLEGGSYDACGIESMTLSENVFECDAIGMNTVTLTVIDPHGNSDACTSVIEVIDDVAPVFTDVADVEVELEPGVCSTAIEYPTIDADDACKDDLTYTLIEGLGVDGDFPLGVTTETWVVEDMGGNTDTLTFTVTVTTYNAAPVINPTDDIVVDEDPSPITVLLTGIGTGGDCDAAQMVDSVAAVASDNALITGIVVTYVDGDATAGLELTIAPDMNGTATVVVTVMDNGGTEGMGMNTTMDTFMVTVNAVNDAPVVDPIADATVIADHTLDIPVDVAFSDVDGDVLTFEVTLENGDPLPAWLVYAGGTLTATPTTSNIGCVEVKVVASDPDAASVTDVFQVCVLPWPTGIEDAFKNIDVKMFPNPAKNLVTLEISGNNGSDVEVVVMNITGKEVLRKDFQTTDAIQFDMSEHVSGMYFVKLNVDGNEVVKKLILDRK